MKVWTVSELDNVVSSLKPLIGTRLQEVQTSEHDLVLGFYSQDGMLWLWVDLNALRPCLLPWTELPLHLPSKKNPLNLFLRAHFRDRILRSIERPEHQGRVVILTFGEGEGAGELELRLFPHGRNILARTDGKKIAWQKPKALSEPGQAPEQPEREIRGLDELREEWLARRSAKGPAKTTKEVKSRLDNELEKKKKALVKVEEELQRKRDLPYKKVGDWLKANQTLDVPKEWEPFVDKRRKLSWNIEECYSRARDLEGKIHGTQNRLELLRAEVERLEKRKDEPLTTRALEKPGPPKPLQAAEAQGRTLRISDEISVISGKSAADNLKLLRKARAWDLWFHLKDYPSSHAILFRNKNTGVSEGVVQQVLAWYVRLYLGSKYKQHSGEKFHILIAECRFVRPIKGDKLGRVTVHGERQVTYQVP